MRLTGFPVSCPREAYDSATDKIASHARQFDQVLAIYRMGNVAHPGISDLDVIVVVEDDEALPSFEFTRELSEMERQTLIHGVFVVSRTFWQQRELFYSYSNLAQLYGPDHPGVSYEENVEQQVRMAIQHLVRTCLSHYVQMTRRCLKVRSLLCGLNAIRFDLLHLDDNVSPEVISETKSALGKLESLREDWFGGAEHRDARLIELVTCLDKCARRILEELAESSAAEAYSKDCQGESEHRISHRSSIVPHAGGVRGTCTQLAHLAPWVSVTMLSERNANRIMNRLGSHTLCLPHVIYSAVRGFGSENMDPEHRRRIELQNAIYSSKTMLAIRQRGHSLPSLIDPGVMV